MYNHIFYLFLISLGMLRTVHQSWGMVHIFGLLDLVLVCYDLENDAVHILAKHVEQEPVSHLRIIK